MDGSDGIHRYSRLERDGDAASRLVRLKVLDQTHHVRITLLQPTMIGYICIWDINVNVG